MKIALVSLSYLPISHESMGGLEVFVNALATQLIVQGHQITLFGLTDSNIEGAEKNGIVSAEEIRSDGLPLDNKFFVRRYVTYQSLALIEALKRESEFDVIHVNLAEWQLGFTLGHKAKNLVVTTHGNYMTPKLTERVLSSCHGPKIATVSNFVAEKLIPDYDRKFVAYNGIDLSLYQPNYAPDDYLLWLGRIAPGKAPHLAIEVAKKTNRKLIIAGGIDYQDYFDQEIKPHLNEQIQYVGPVFGQEKAELLARARVSLFTSQLEESFGLVAAESLACGTPTIAFDKGALKEVVSDKETGYIVNTVEEMAERVNDIDQISREACHQRVVENFSLSKMAERYLEIYQN